MTEVIKHTPNTALAVSGGQAYQEHLSRFKARAELSVQLEQAGAVEHKGLDARDAGTVGAITRFLQGIRAYSNEQWQEGVALGQAEVQALCGRDPLRHPLDKARRACLVGVSGNRKLGEKTTYRLNKAAINGLAMVLVRNGAYVEAEAMQAMEAAEKQLIQQERLDQVLQPHLYEGVSNIPVLLEKSDAQREAD